MMTIWLGLIMRTNRQPTKPEPMRRDMRTCRCSSEKPSMASLAMPQMHHHLTTASSSMKKALKVKRVTKKLAVMMK